VGLGFGAASSLNWSYAADVAGRQRAISFVCLDCLLDNHPKLGRGLEIAREYGVADPDENDKWAVGDLSRLERN
jgi:hypothetical protein